MNPNPHLGAPKIGVGLGNPCPIDLTVGVQLRFSASRYRNDGPVSRHNRRRWRCRLEEVLGVIRGSSNSLLCVQIRTDGPGRFPESTSMEIEMENNMSEQRSNGSGGSEEILIKKQQTEI